MKGERKMKKFNLFVLIMLVMAMFFATGCTERVPPGYIGMVMTPSGLTGEVLAPGNHKCYNRDRMVLVEYVEKAYKEPLSILCADDLNFKFDLKIRVMTFADDNKAVMNVLGKQGSQINWGKDATVGVLPFDILYNTYVSDPARSIARGVVSKYRTTDIRDARDEITKAITEQLVASVKGTPVKIMLMATSNFDYPKVITDAVEQKRKREIDIETEKAVQAMALLQMENRKILAQKRKHVRAIEAEAEAVYVRIMGKALTSDFLRLRAIERDVTLYENVGPGDKVIVTGNGGITPLIDVTPGKK
jgi:hypothetical protein